ncbi:MAG: hypothetical protein ACW990_20495 [Promethearchaeota archaeon]|jgi:hypothetical protein
MANSWKIGAVSGLVAGIVVGIFWSIVPIIAINLRLVYWWLPPPPETSILVFVLTEMGLAIVFGAIFGVLYSKAYRVISGNAIRRGLIFGLFLLLMYTGRFAMINAAYGRVAFVITMIIWGLGWIPFGIILGSIFESLRSRYYSTKEPEIKTYAMRSGILPGAIAGLVGGMATFVTIVIVTALGIWYFIPEQLSDVEFLVSQFGSQTFFHLVGCTVFALFYPKVYNLLPGKGVAKGLAYGLIGFLITEGRALGYGVVYGFSFNSDLILFLGKQMLLLGLTVWIVFGIVLGYLYRKPSE